MNLHALDIPETTEELAHWLERHLVGLHLGTLVAELMAVHADAPHKPLEDILGDDLGRILESGLAGVSRERLGELLRHPTSLLELQEQIVIEGGRYWETCAQTNTEVQTQVSAGWRRLQSAIAAPQHLATAQAAGGSSVMGGTTPIGRRQILLAMAATAAAVLMVSLAVVQLQSPAQAAVAWGWDKPGALQDDVSAPVYLANLSRSAREWSKKRPATNEDLGKRLREFRHGCETLIAAGHRPLAAADKDWLIERCNAWKAKIEGHIADLEKGVPLSDVLKAADETVEKLATALETRKVA